MGTNTSPEITLESDPENDCEFPDCPEEGDECADGGCDDIACKAACIECDNDKTLSYGCCGTCVYIANDQDILECSQYVPQDLVCPDTTTDAPCVCTKEYMPYCCDGNEYGNGCMAACDGYDVDDDSTVCYATTDGCDDVSNPSEANQYGMFAGVGFIVTIFGWM